MILSRSPNISPCRSQHVDAVVFRDAPCLIPFFTDIIIHSATSGISSSMWFFSWGCWRRPTNSVPLFAMVCITRSIYWSWLLAQDTRFFSSPSRRLISGSRLASIFIPRSLADFAFRHPTSFHFSFYFLTSMCQYRRLISALHAFATSHHASYFGSREFGSVQKESTRPIYIKTKSPPQASAQPCVYDERCRCSGCAPQFTY